MKTRWLAALAAIALWCIPAKAQGPVINDPANGLTQTFSSGSAIVPGQIVKLNGNGQVIPVTTSDTAAPIGIAATGANGQFQTIIVSIGGTQNVLVDAACTIGQKVQISATNAGYGDCSASPSLGTVGLALTASASLGKVSVQLQIGGGSSSGSGFPVTAPQTVGNGGSISVTPGSSGSIAGVAVAAPCVAFYLTNTASTANTGCSVYTFMDTNMATGCSYSNSAPDVTCPSGPFLPTDCVGGSGCTGTGSSKVMMGGIGCLADGNTNAAPSYINTSAMVSIASYISATHITLASNPAGSIAPGCVVWGHEDNPGFAALNTIVQTATPCPKVQLVGYYLINAPPGILTTNPPACAIGSAAGTAGNLTLAVGFRIDGIGRGPTAIFFDMAFQNATCNVVLGAATTAACMGAPVEGELADLRFDGGPQTTAPSLAGKILMNSRVAHIHNVTFTNYGHYTATMNCLTTSLNVMLDDVDVSCGGIGVQSDPSTGAPNNFWKRLFSESSSVNALLLNTSNDVIYCDLCDFANAQSGAGPATIQNNGGKLFLHNGRDFVWNGNGSVSNISAYRASGGTLAANEEIFNASTVGGGTGNAGIYCQTGSCVVSLINGTTVSGQNFDYADQGTGTLYYDNSVTFTTTPFTSVAIGGKVINPPFPVQTTGTYTNATTTFSNVTGLTFTALDHLSYTVDCDIVWQGSAATTGPKYQWTGPGTPTNVTASATSQVTATTITQSTVTAFSSSMANTGAITAATNFTDHLHLALQNGSTTSTAVQLQAAANAAGTLTIQPGSVCHIQ